MADSVAIIASGNWPTAPPTVQPAGFGSQTGQPIFIWDLENVIWFTDATVLADAIAALGGDRLYMSPQHARTLFGISTQAPYMPSGGPAADVTDPAVTIWIDYSRNNPPTHRYDPLINGQWQVERVAGIGHQQSLPSGFDPLDIPFYDETHDWFVINGWEPVGTFGLDWPPYKYYWSFQLRQFGGAARNPPTAPPTPAPISRRRWIDGFELPTDGAGGSGNLEARSRDSARAIDGYGLAVRNMSNVFIEHQVTEFGAANSHDSWERGYIRIRRYPSAGSDAFWAIFGSISAGNLNFLRVSTGGQLEFTEGAGPTVIASAPVGLDTWMRLDLFIHYSSNAGVNPGTVQLYINRQLVLNISTITAFGIGQNQNHLGTRIGAPSAAAANGLEIDIDDWMNADIPPALTGMDWLMGSRMQLIRATGEGAAHQGANWTGNWRATLNNPVLSVVSVITSAIPSSTLEVTTDLHDEHISGAPPLTAPSGAAELLQQGVAAAVVGLFSQGPGGVSTLSMHGAPGAIASVSVTQGVQQWLNLMYRPSGMITPTPLGPMTLRMATSSSGGTTSIFGFAATVEDLGIFGPEDFDPTVSPAPPAPPQYSGIHNAPFPRSKWALIGGMPGSSVFVAYGVYTGNGTGADLDLPYPPCWLYVRPVTPAGADGVRWWSSTLAAHGGLQPAVLASHMAQALIDPTVLDGSSEMRRSGTSPSSNANGNTFQYVAFCDPGQRFVINGAFAIPPIVASRIFELINSGFLPEAGFFNIEQIGTLATADFWYKGVGHAPATAQRLSAAETVNVVSFNTGDIVPQTPLNQAVAGSRAQTAFSLWRQSDGQPLGPSQGVVVFLGSYTGDGIASRVIPCTLGGRFPAFAQVTPHNAVSWVRDPSHTGANSSQANALSTISTTAITAGGINSITVGITLNANGIIYDVFVLPSCSLTGWNNDNGDYCPLNFGGYSDPPGVPPAPYVPSTPVEGGEDLCADDWGTPRADGLPYVPLMPGATQDENQ